jgi:hypothetical protein
MLNEEVLSEINEVLKKYEETLTFRRGGSIAERVENCLSQYRSIADNAIFSAKSFAEDVKTQFKALEMITEGLTSEGMNHGQKRVIANHIITMLRSMIDRVGQHEYRYSTDIFQRYNWFRSEVPERRLYESLRDLKDQHKRDEAFIKLIKDKFPDVLEKLNEEDIPF